MNMKKLTNAGYLKNQYTNLLKYFYALEARTRNLLLLLLAVIVISFIFNTFFKPQRTAIRQLKQEAVTVKNRVMALRAQFPEVDKEKRQLEKAQRSLRVLKEELTNLEAQLPHQDSLPGLLNELVKESSGYAIDFNEIKPIDHKDSKEYERLNIEMKFNTNFSGLVNYLRRLEHLSEFISTTSVLIEEKKQVMSSVLMVTLKLSTLLSDKEEPVKLRSSQDTVKEIPQVSVVRNPFMSKFKPILKQTEDQEYKLTGIIGQGAIPTAIINDEVYQEGDWVGSSQVIEISSNTVTLKMGGENLLLTLEDTN